MFIPPIKLTNKKPTASAAATAPEFLTDYCTERNGMNGFHSVVTRLLDGNAMAYAIQLPLGSAKRLAIAKFTDHVQIIPRQKSPIMVR